MRLILIVFSLIIISSCITQHIPKQRHVVKEKTLVGECKKGWLKYKMYRMPTPDNQGKNKLNATQQPLMFTLMIINMEGGTSPLRRICRDLEQYNFYYEYLLNQVKNDLMLISKEKVQYPTSYSFENSYNAFPFESINVGFAPVSAHRRGKDIKIVFLDKVFTHDTLVFPVGQTL